jgi:hypothetical protein
MLYNQYEPFMKRISSLALCGMISTCAIAAPHATWQTVEGQERIVISQLPSINTPPIAANVPLEQDDPFSVEHASPNRPLSLVEAAIAGAKQAPATPVIQSQKATHAPSLLVKKVPVSKTVKPAKAPMPTYVVTKGQSYMTALRQWVAKDTQIRVAWALPSDTVTALETVSPNGQVFKGSLSQVVTSLGKQLKTPLHFTQNPMKKLAAIHNLDSNVELSWVHGTTLKDAVYNLTTDFGWSWEARTARAQGSWRSPDNFPLAAAYPIVSPRGDFAFALNTVLEGYPVQAQLLYGTKNLFIMEKQ